MMVLTIVFCIQKNSATVQLHVPLSVMIIFKAIMMIKSKSFLWGHFPGIRHILPTILDKLKVSYFSRLITPIPGYDDDEESRREGVKTAMDFDSDEVQWHKSKLFFWEKNLFVFHSQETVQAVRNSTSLKNILNNTRNKLQFTYFRKKFYPLQFPRIQKASTKVGNQVGKEVSRNQVST